MLQDDGQVWALGSMSGTSLDGVDAAMLRTDGHGIDAFGPADYRPYCEGERAILRDAMGRWDGLEAAERVVREAHVDLLSGFSGAQIVGFHGQTTAHDPHGRGTCQIGDGAALALALGLPVVWDFRRADVASGGQGAPLAPFFHHACARWAGLTAPVAFLNLGGVGNLTWLDPSVEAPEADGTCLAFDTGPANAPLNDLMAARRDAPLDEGGALAASGKVDDTVLDRLRSQSYLSKTPPKSLDRNDFDWLDGAVAGLADADAAATLTAAIAVCVAEGLRHCPTPPARVFVTGGGRNNPVLMAMLVEWLTGRVAPVEEIGLDGDMLEAQAFGYLAVRAARGLPLTAPMTTGVAAPLTGGRLSGP